MIEREIGEGPTCKLACVIDLATAFAEGTAGWKGDNAPRVGATEPVERACAPFMLGDNTAVKGRTDLI